VGCYAPLLLETPGNTAGQRRGGALLRSMDA
jgi:hypothetical protein